MKKDELKAELRKLGLSEEGIVKDLRIRLRQARKASQSAAGAVAREQKPMKTSSFPYVSCPSPAQDVLYVAFDFEHTGLNASTAMCSGL
jgi:hypothetical protein